MELLLLSGIVWHGQLGPAWGQRAVLLTGNAAWPLQGYEQRGRLLWIGVPSNLCIRVLLPRPRTSERDLIWNSVIAGIVKVGLDWNRVGP